MPSSPWGFTHAILLVGGFLPLESFPLKIVIFPGYVSLPEGNDLVGGLEHGF